MPSLVDYMNAGYIPWYRCREDVAIGIVKNMYEGGEVELQDGRFIIDGFLPSKYYFENDILFYKE